LEVTEDSDMAIVPELSKAASDEVVTLTTIRIKTIAAVAIGLFGGMPDFISRNYAPQGLATFAW